MTLAIVGSRGVMVDDLESRLPQGVTKIISGGAVGVDTCARDYALAHGIPIVEILPDYARYRRYAPLKRNIEIVQAADEVLVFWDGKSRGTKHVLEECQRQGKPVHVVNV